MARGKNAAAPSARGPRRSGKEEPSSEAREHRNKTVARGKKCGRAGVRRADQSEKVNSEGALFMEREAAKVLCVQRDTRKDDDLTHFVPMQLGR